MPRLPGLQLRHRSRKYKKVKKKFSLLEFFEFFSFCFESIDVVEDGIVYSVHLPENKTKQNKTKQKKTTTNKN